MLSCSALRPSSRARKRRIHARHPAGVPSVRQKPCFTHGILPETLQCVRSPVPRTVSLRSPFCASKALFHARYPCRRPSCASEAPFHARHPCWDPPVRQKPRSTHDIHAETLPCARSPVPRTVSLRSPFYASKALFHARYPCRSPSCASEGRFHARHPAGVPPVRQKPRSTHGGCPRRLTSAGRRVDIQKKFFCFLASAHVSFLYLRLLCILLRL